MPEVTGQGSELKLHALDGSNVCPVLSTVLEPAGRVLTREDGVGKIKNQLRKALFLQKPVTLC